jgi:hypothetical protein
MCDAVTVTFRERQSAEFMQLHKVKKNAAKYFHRAFIENAVAP